MRRREFLFSTGTALGISFFPIGWTPAADRRKQKVLYFTRSQSFEHGPVARKEGKEAFSEKVLKEMAGRAGFEVVCTKDGRVFDGDLAQFDAFAFYTSGDLTLPDPKHSDPPMSAEGKKRLLDAVAGGKGFVGFHSATDSFHSPGPRGENSPQVDPYIAMLGGEFISHGPQQQATLTNTSPKFPGMEGIPEKWRLLEEWYALKNFAKDLHVILVQETEGMVGAEYQRPPFPATWARKHHNGRVFYTSFGHREDIWTNPQVQQLILGGFAWVMKNAEADVTPNLDRVTPRANELPAPQPRAAKKAVPKRTATQSKQASK